MKSRMRSYSNCVCRLYSSMSAGSKPGVREQADRARRSRSGSGGCWSTRSARRSRWTGPRRHSSCPRLLAPAPGVNGMKRGSASGLPSRLFIRMAVASSSLHEAAGIDVAVADAVLQRDAPLPARGVRGGARVGQQRLDRLARHGDRAVARQPVRPVLVAGSSSACSISRARMPEQSMKKSPSTVSPLSRTTARMKPSGSRCSVSTILPSVRTTPRFSA